MANPIDDAKVDRLAWYDITRDIWWKQVTWGEIDVIQAERLTRGIPLLRFYTERGRAISRPLAGEGDSDGHRGE